MRVVLSVVGAVVVAWLLFIGFLAAVRPDGTSLKEASRLLPDTLRLIRRLATDAEISRRARVPLFLLVGYLALPIDLVPDFIPVLGYADDAILVSLVLRGLIRRAGATKVAEHWPGSDEGLVQLRRILRLA